MKGFERIKGDERILGGSSFVESVLSQAQEQLDRRYELRSRGIDLDNVAERIALIFGMEKPSVFSKGKQKRTVLARSVLCFWCTRELGMTQTELAKILEISVPAMGYAVVRGERIVGEQKISLLSEET